MNPKLIQVYKDRLKTVGENWAAAHLRWMLDNISTFTDPLKEHRWIGFVQGAWRHDKTKWRENYPAPTHWHE